MRRIIVAAAVAGVALAALPAQAGAGITETSNQIWIVHGIGDDPGENEVDVYQRQAGSAEPFSILIAGIEDEFGFADSFDTGSADPGDYDVLVCTATADPDPTIESCADNEELAVNGNSGNVVTIVDAPFMSLLIGYGEAGRPAVLPFVPDVDCVDPDTGRLTVAHGADAGPADVALGTDVVIFGLDNGAAEAVDRPADPYHLQISDGEELDINAVGFLIDAEINRMTFVVGDPDAELEYTLVTQDYVLETCDQPTTTTSTSTSTTTTVRPADVTRPRFTG